MGHNLSSKTLYKEVDCYAYENVLELDAIGITNGGLSERNIPNYVLDYFNAIGPFQNVTGFFYNHLVNTKQNICKNLIRYFTNII